MLERAMPVFGGWALNILSPGFGGNPSSVQSRRLVAVARLFEDHIEPIVPREGNDYYDAAAEAAAREAYYSDIRIGGSVDRAESYYVLSALLKETHTFKPGYSEARRKHLYPNVDLHPDGKLRGVYTGRVFSPQQAIVEDLMAEFKLGEFAPALKPGAGRILAPMLAGAEVAGHNRPLFNCEHSVPQSWYGKRQPMRGDLHTLFTADPGCNGNRGSLPFGDNGGADGMACGIARSKFEPARNKGAVARATLYFLMRYPGRISHRKMPKDTVDTLIKWHKADPPSLWELHRNQEIAKVQGNRNPLIDHPEWADLIDFKIGISGGSRKRD
ncbi:MAG: endonuclease [Myxococcota bacterium]